MSPRKKPHCRNCGSPMAGHKRPSGIPTCNGPPSPPASPSSSSSSYSKLTSLPISPPASETSDTPPLLTPHHIDEIVIPKYGIWRRPNPHWADPPHPPSTPYAGSLVPTVLDDDDMKMEYPDSIDDAYFDTFDTLDTVASEATEAMMDQVLSRTTPLASLFRTRREEIPYIRDLADRIGLHFGLLKADRERDQLWIALGKSAEGVQYMLNLEQRRMPGVFTKGVILEEDVMAGAKPLYSSLGLCQVALAGVIGGLVVVYGLSLL